MANAMPKIFNGTCKNPTVLPPTYVMYGPSGSNILYKICPSIVMSQYHVRIYIIIMWEWTLTLHKKWSFPLKISSVNVTKSLMESFIFCAVLMFTLTRQWYIFWHDTMTWYTLSNIHSHTEKTFCVYVMIWLPKLLMKYLSLQPVYEGNWESNWKLGHTGGKS